MPDENAIRAVAAQVVATWNAHDMKAFAQLFRDDAEFVNVYGDWWTGRERIEAEHAKTHGSVFRESRLSTQDMKITFLRPDVASLHVRWELVGLAIPNGPKLPDRKGVLVYILVYEGGSWKIAVGQNTDIAPSPG